EKRVLNLDKQLLDYDCNSLLRYGDLPFAAGTVAPREHSVPGCHIFRAKLDPQRNAPHFPIIEFEAGTHALTLVHLDANIGGDQLSADFLRGLENRALFVVALKNRDDNYLIGGQAWRQNETLIVSV